MGDADGVPDLAARLNHLFATVPRPDGRGLWTNEQAAQYLAKTGTPMSDGYISQLRNGKRVNPSARNLAALASLFAVPMEYFFNQETAEKINADLRLLTVLRDGGVEGIALRAQGLSRETLAGLEGILDGFRRLAHLPTETPPSPREDDKTDNSSE